MKQDLNKLKEQYTAIKASDELRKRVSDTMNQQIPIKKKSITKRVGVSVACVVAAMAVFTGALNFSPAFAQSISEAGLGGMVNVLTFNRYEFSKNGAEANIQTPQIQGLSDPEFEAKLNAELKENAEAVIQSFNEDLKALEAEFPGETVHMGVDYGYEVKTNNNDYLSIDVYQVNTAGSSSTMYWYYTVDKHTNQLVTLPSMFKDGADYVGVLSEYIKTQMRAQMDAGENYYWLDEQEDYMENFDKIKPDQKFYINNDGNLVICFDKYEVAPGSSGSPEFEIPLSVIAGVLK